MFNLFLQFSDRFIPTSQQEVRNRSIPQELKSSFSWLAQEDITLYERLLNFFQRQEMELACQEVSAILPMLQQQKREHPDLTSNVVKTVYAGGQTIELIIDGAPNSTAAHEWTPPVQERTFSWWPWIAAAVVLFFIIAVK